MSTVERPSGAIGSMAAAGPAASAAPPVEVEAVGEVPREVLLDWLVRRRGDEARRLDDEERDV